MKPIKLIAAAAILALGGMGAFAFLSNSQSRPELDHLQICLNSAGRAGGRIFHIDPLRGRDDGNGSAERPWRSIQHVFDQGLVGDRMQRPSLLEKIRARVTGNWHDFAMHDNPTSVVHGGDTIALASGSYGRLEMAGLSNDLQITIAAAPDAVVKFDSIAISGSRAFTFKDLMVEPKHAGQGSFLVTTRPAPDSRRSQDILFENVSIKGAGNIATTDPKVWSRSAAGGALLFGECLGLRNSSIRNVRFGAVIYRSSRVFVQNNEISDFSVDGIDFSGSDLTIKDNVIHSNWPTGDNLHSDCMQGQSGDDHPPYQHVRIIGNVCLSSAAKSREGEIQGINIFDGRWSDVEVKCNLVRPSLYHAVTLYGVDNGLIERNIVFGWNNHIVPWIAAMPAKNGRPPSNTIIQGNSSTGYINAVHGSVRDTRQLMEELRLNPADKHFRSLVARAIPGVRLTGNGWMHPGPDMSEDSRFLQPGSNAPASAVSVANAKAELRKFCPNL